MKIAVMGAGSVGCYYGGMLARAGHSVVLIGRHSHVEAMQRMGLLMETQSFTAHVPLAASVEASALRGAKLILCCVKSTDSETAAAEMAPFLDSDAVVLSLQNGVDNAARLQALLPQRVAPAVVYVATEMAGPGHVRHHGRGELVLGPVEGAEFADCFNKAGVPIEISGNVSGALWMKLILNCAYNALSAVTQLPYGKLVQGVGVLVAMRDVVDECLAVAQAEGVALPGDPWAAVLRIAETMAGQISSTAQDVARRKPSEIDHLNGYVVRKGIALGIATPVNRLLHAQVRLLESAYAN